MKKNYFMLAAATMMFAACAQTDMVNEIATEETPQAIEFETFAQKATRAENSQASYGWNLSDHHKTFKVWGYKDLSNKKVFDGVTVTNNSNSWGYDTPVYWDKIATRYDFYAAAPATVNDADFWTLNDNSTTDINTDDYLTTAQFQIPSHNEAEYQEYEQTASPTGATSVFEDCTDLMIAENKVVNKNVGEVPSTVGLNFIHILSRLNVTVKATIDDVTVKKVLVGGMNSTGSFSESPTLKNDDGSDKKLTAADIEDGTYLRWTLSDANGTVSYQNDTDQPLTKNTTYLAVESLVMPQLASYSLVDLSKTQADLETETEPYLYIEYSINGEDYTQAYNLAAAFDSQSPDAAVPFNEGWQNTLNISIGGNLIEFTANAAIWVDKSTGETPIQ